MARSSNRDSQIRNGQLARIHIAKQRLDMDDETYRMMLARVTGKTSAAGMASAELDKVIAELERVGAIPARKPARRAHPGRPKRTGNVPMLKKVEALLADAGRPWSYAHSIAKHMFGVDRLEFLDRDQLRKVVAALQIDAHRRSKP